MKLVIGLGNPGPEYVATRHNVGFMAVERLIDDLKGKFKTWGQQKNALLADVSIDGERVLVLKPLTYMNLSGQAAVAAAHFYKILPEDICVLHDELDLPLGTVRLKTGGGPGGHNGLRSLIASLATPNFSRVRMGVGKPENKDDTSDFVLGPFRKQDLPLVEDMIERALQAIAAFAKGEKAFLAAMNTLNQRN